MHKARITNCYLCNHVIYLLQLDTTVPCYYVVHWRDPLHDERSQEVVRSCLLPHQFCQHYVSLVCEFSSAGLQQV